jgi:hypothetical protein
MSIAEGLDSVALDLTSGRRVVMPFITPKRFVAIMDWKIEVSGLSKEDLPPIPAFRARREIFPGGDVSWV